MKTIPRLLITGLTLLTLLLAFSLQPSALHAQGTAFSYQGRLNDGGNPATGIYDLRFTICDALTSGNVVAGPNTSSATGVTNGLFTVTLDFGSGVFTGSNRWVEIAARTNGAASFTTLAPRQPILPAPYAIMANSASNLLGTLPTAQLTGTFTGNGSGLTSLNPASLSAGMAGINISGNAATATTANNFSGSLAGDVTGPQGATVVTSVGGSTAAYIHSAEQAANAATSANTASAIVKRDASGNFSAGTLTLSGTLNLPATPIIYANYGTLLFADDNINFYAGPSAGKFDAGFRNTGIGGGALYDNTSGSYNTANGYNALDWNSTGSDNTAVGFAAMFENTSGSRNTAFGETSLEYVGGSDNIAIGYNAGVNIGPGNYNVDIGNGGFSSDNETIRIGTQGIQTNTFIEGIYNNIVPAGKPVYVDSNGQFGTSASSSVALLNGNETFTGIVTFNNSSDSFTGNGSGLTGLNAANLSGTFTGTVIGNASTATTANNFSGSLAGDVTGTQGATSVANVGGQNAANVASGAIAANAATSAATASTIVKRDGSGNFTSTSITLNGNLNLPATTASAGIIYSGGNRLIHAYGNNNFFAGAGAGNFTMSGSGNTANGASALGNNGSGSLNTAVGYGALASNTGGSWNTAVGYWALGGNNLTGTNNIALGNGAGNSIILNNNIDIGNQGTASDAGIIRIGDQQTQTFIAGVINGNGAGLINLNVSQLDVGGSVGFLIEPGNGGSTPNVIGGLANNSIATYGGFIGGGTVNVIQTNSQNAAIGGGEHNTIMTNAYDSTISGGTGNSIQGWAFQSTIGGGGGNIISNNASYSTIGGGAGNVIQGWANGSSIGAGEGNVIQTNSDYSTIGGGDLNLIQVNALYAAIAGGASNTVSAFATNSFIGGGAMNTIQTNATASTIAGGINNTIQPNAGDAAIGGGSGNTVQTNADNATIAGGLNNTIQFNDFHSAIGGGSGNSIKMNTSDAVIGGGAANSIQSNANYSVISGGHFNTINSNTFSAVIGGGEFNAISNGATYAVIPGGSRAAAIHYGQFAFASGDFSASGDAQASVYVLRGQANSASFNSLYLDGSSQMLTVPTGAVWAFDILVVGGINGSASAAFKITGAIRNYGGTVAFIGTPTVTSLGADTGASTWNAQVAVNSGALDVQAKGTGSTYVSWVANVRTVEVTPTY